MSRFYSYLSSIVGPAFLATFIFLAGCESKTDPPGSAPAGQPPTTSGQANQKTPHVVIRRPARPAQKSFLISDLLNQTDLSPEVRQTLTRSQQSGMVRITESNLDDMIEAVDSGIVGSILQKAYRPSRARTERSAEPIVYSEQPTMTADFMRGIIKFDSVGLEHFDSLEHVGLAPEAKAAAREQMQRALQNRYELTGKVPWKMIVQKMEELRSANKLTLNKDPMFLFCYGFICDKAGNQSTAVWAYELALYYFRTSEYPARTLVRCLQFLNQRDKIVDASKKEKFRMQYCRAIIYWLRNDFRAEPQEHRYAWDLIVSFLTYNESRNRLKYSEFFLKRIAEETSVPEWLRCMTRGRFEDRMGWLKRGGGFANTVSKDGWMSFEDHQKRARDFFRRAYEINPMFPEAASFMIEISRTGYDEDSQDEWFQRAIEGGPDYLTAFSTRLFGFSPQWGGTIEQMQQFTLEQLEKAPPGSMVAYLPVITHNEIKFRASASPEEKMMAVKDPEFAQAIIDSLADLAGREEEQVVNFRYRSPRFFHTLRALFAADAQKFDVSLESLDLLVGKQFDSGGYKIFTETGQQTYEAMYSRIELLANQALRDAAVPIFEKAANQSATDMKGLIQGKTDLIAEIDQAMEKHPEDCFQKYVASLRGRLTMERDYLSGKKVQYNFTPSLSKWKMTNAQQFQYDSEDSVYVDNQNGVPNFELLSIIRLPGPKIVEFDIELPLAKDKNRTSAAFIPGIRMINLAQRPFYIGLGRLYQPNPGPFDDVGNLLLANSDTRKRTVPFVNPVKKGKNHLRIQVCKGYLEVYLNKEFLYRSRNPRILGATEQLSICQPEGVIGTGRAKFSNITVKFWLDGAPPFGDNEKLIEYFKKRAEEENDNPWSEFFLANAYHEDEQFELAVTHYQKAAERGLPEHEIWFYVGDCKDRLGDLEAAIDYYQKTLSQKDIKVGNAMAGTFGEGYTQAQHWAMYRLKYIGLTSDNASLREKAQVAGDAKKLPFATQWIGTMWANELLNILEVAKQNPKSAVPLAEKLLVECNVDQEETLLEMINAFENDSAYSEKKDAQRFYLQFSPGAPYFRCIEESLPKSLGFRGQF